MKKILAVILGSCAFIYLVWVVMYPTTTYRYRMIVEINTPEGIKSGSSVIEVKTVRFPRWMTLGHTDHELHMRGEAVTVDLGERGMLFAILRGHPWDVDYPKHIVPETFGRIPAKHDSAPLPRENMPMMVTFSDMSDPTSVKLAYHVELDREASSPPKGQFYHTVDNFTELFGVGVEIAHVTIEVTDDAVTTGIIKTLPWLPEYYNKKFDGRRFETIKAENRLANSLAAGYFAAYTVEKKENQK